MLQRCRRLGPQLQHTGYQCSINSWITVSERARNPNLSDEELAEFDEIITRYGNTDAEMNGDPPTVYFCAFVKISPTAEVNS